MKWKVRKPKPKKLFEKKLAVDARVPAARTGATYGGVLLPSSAMPCKVPTEGMAAALLVPCPGGHPLPVDSFTSRDLLTTRILFELLCSLPGLLSAMGDYKIQISTKLINQLAHDDEKVKKDSCLPWVTTRSR